MTGKRAKAKRATRATPKKARKPPRRASTPDWAPNFLAAFAQTGVVSYACERVGIDRATAYRRRQADEDFAVAWSDAEERGTELLEAEAHRRAALGVDEPVGFYKGKPSTTVKKYSDTLLIFLLKARRPDKYRENVQVDHTGRVQHGVTVLDGQMPVDVSPAKRRKIAAILAEPEED